MLLFLTKKIYMHFYIPNSTCELKKISRKKKSLFSENNFF